MENDSTAAEKPQVEWWERHDEIARLAEHMAYSGESAETVAHMVGKPWHYQDAYEQMESAQLAADNALKIESEA